MGWYLYPAKPGSANGPCLDPCHHLDCAQSRRDALSLGPICRQPVGYESRVYFFEDRLTGKLAVEHADCRERIDQLARLKHA
jgi:hypothetical protein